MNILKNEESESETSPYPGLKPLRGLEYVPPVRTSYKVDGTRTWVYAITEEMYELKGRTFLQPTSVVGLDFETYCELDINKVGLHRYIYHPSFRPLTAAIVYNVAGNYGRELYDFVINPDTDLPKFADAIFEIINTASVLAAHNAGFEREVLHRMGLSVPTVSDTAVISRGWGGSSKLEFAAKQFLGKSKLESGRHLLNKFSTGPQPPQREDVLADPDWVEFCKYNMRDAQLSYDLHSQYGYLFFHEELVNERVTSRMNKTGWHVDMKMVKEMQTRYLVNKDEMVSKFRKDFGLPNFNFNSLKDMKEWCNSRGVKATSFAEDKVNDLVRKVSDKVQQFEDSAANNTPRPYSHQKFLDYCEVLEMLKVKQALGGSSLTKLVKIMELTSEDDKLRHQYMHVGAGQTFRTSGTGVQMQNLKRMHGRADVDTLFDSDEHWTNDQMASNIRQVFVADAPESRLIVGDFSSVESRGLAYLADEQWKLDEYRRGKDMYKVLADRQYHVGYDNITKDQRTFGKVGELSCGYGAGAGAVQSFAKGMGVILSDDEAAEVVNSWRTLNPKIVKFWGVLDDALHAFVNGNEVSVSLAEGKFFLEFNLGPIPPSLSAQHPGARTLVLSLQYPDKSVIMARVIQGLYLRGRDVCYYKAGETIGGQPWKAFYMDPKTKERKFYKIYGGKLAGILTQSFCRELFFESLRKISTAADQIGITVVGQFHDEIVINWNPSIARLPLQQTMEWVQHFMTYSDKFPDFPLAAEIKYDYRYTK